MTFAILITCFYSYYLLYRRTDGVWSVSPFDDDAASDCASNLYRTFAHKQWNSLTSLKLYLTSSCVTAPRVSLMLNALAHPKVQGEASLLQQLEVRCSYAHIHNALGMHSYL
jgi:hypothetical protein